MACADGQHEGLDADELFPYSGRWQPTMRSSSPGLAKKKCLRCWLLPRTPLSDVEGDWWRDRMVAGDELCDKCWALWRRTSTLWVTLFCTHTTMPNYTQCLGMRVLVCAVEAVLRRLLLQFRYMPTRELLNRRLAARDVKHSKALQGTMTWFLINTNVSDDDWTWDFWIANFNSLIKVIVLSTLYMRKSTFDESKTYVQKMMCSDVTAQHQSPWNQWLSNISFWWPDDHRLDCIKCVWWVGVSSERRCISSRGEFSSRRFSMMVNRSRSAGPTMLLRWRQCTS